MTTRPDDKLFYYKSFISFDADKAKRNHPWLHQFWRNGRTKHPEFYKIGIAEWSGCVRKAGEYFTEEDAIRDGFGDLYDYKAVLANHNNMTLEDVNHHVWTQLLWEKDGWVEGPHYPPIYNPAWLTQLQARRVA
jgi:hypothetical protein